jgi:aminopeptidase
MQPLKELMDKTDKVKIIAKDTNLTFSLKGRVSSKCDGHANIPDGEVCTTPVKNSVNGTITYNIPSNNNGFVFTDISFTFENGKLIKAASNDNARINKILDIDEGARYVGEFAIGVNPFVNKYIVDTLFDEKMAGSIHFTPGAGEGNESSIHWDIIQCHTKEFGGGEIWFDNRLIRKDGIFIADELRSLNPDELTKILE